MYLLDTNVVIDFCNSKLPIKARNLLLDIEPLVSVVTQIELFASPNIPQEEVLVLESFLKIATIFCHFENELIFKTIQIRQKYKTKLPDAIIAATAITNGLILITRNITDFKNIEGLQVIDPWVIA